MSINVGMAVNTKALKIAFAVVGLIPIFVVNMNKPPVKRILDVNTTMLASVVAFFSVSFTYLFPAMNITEYVILGTEICISKPKLILYILCDCSFALFVKYVFRICGFVSINSIPHKINKFLGCLKGRVSSNFFL